ncbi:unnamed protein product [Paramecium octaurelia]|uniref:Uncharacterized protein n=1 Tax=Paramecium octaurelia TaxID=43137 RepID=A0A8S1WWL5_PAROT|nr:unnamed protein product [Paramecium octaurelia]
MGNMIEQIVKDQFNCQSSFVDQQKIPIDQASFELCFYKM